jgi:hypothetical protein
MMTARIFSTFHAATWEVLVCVLGLNREKDSRYVKMSDQQRRSSKWRKTGKKERKRERKRHACMFREKKL